MDAMTPFNFDGVGVRVVTIDGEPWFVGRDVADVLGYVNPQKAVRDHCRNPKPIGIGGERIVHPLDPQTVILSESDVLRLVVKSNLPAADRFERWVFEDVLPTIRRTGGYGKADPMAALSDPATLRTALLAYTEKVLALESRVAEQAPKVAALDRIATADGSLCITEAAKCLQVRPRDLFRWLQAHTWIYRRVGGAAWVAYQPRLQQGVLVHKVGTTELRDGTQRITEQVRVTPKGLARLSELLGKLGVAA